MSLQAGKRLPFCSATVPGGINPGSITDEDRALLAAAVLPPQPALAFHFGFARAPGRMDGALALRGIARLPFWPLVAVTKPGDAPFRDVFSGSGRISRVARLSHIVPGARLFLTTAVFLPAWDCDAPPGPDLGA